MFGLDHVFVEAAPRRIQSPGTMLGLARPRGYADMLGQPARRRLRLYRPMLVYHLLVLYHALVLYECHVLLLYIIYL